MDQATLELFRTWLPIGISVLSLLIGGAALTWNIVRELVLKARVRVRLDIVREFEGPQEVGRSIRIRATNYGPGPVQITSIGGKYGLLTRLRDKWPLFWVRPASDNPYNKPMPARLEVGEEFTHLLPYEKDCLFKHLGVIGVGVSDSYERNHYAPKKQLDTATREYEKDFGPRQRLKP